MGSQANEVTVSIPYTKVDCFAAALDAINGLGLKVTTQNQALGMIQATVGPSFTSTTWSDTLTVSITERAHGCNMTVNSSARVVALMAGRQQAKNVQRFMDEFDIMISWYKQITPSAGAVSGNAADEIRKYKELLDDGIITQAEFDAKKKQLLEL